MSIITKIPKIYVRLGSHTRLMIEIKSCSCKNFSHLMDCLKNMSYDSDHEEFRENSEASEEDAEESQENVEESEEDAEESQENVDESEEDTEESQENVEESEDLDESEQDSEDLYSDNSSESERPQTNKRKLELELNPNKKLKTENEHSERRLKNDLRKPLTANELRQMRETENLYNSSLFRLQIEELLKGVKIKQKYKSSFDTWLDDFKYFISQTLPEYEDVKLSELTDTKVKFFKSVFDTCQSSLNADQDVTLKFGKPQACNVFGLHKINASIGPKVSFNINIVMPKSCFLEKDYLNNRYFVKRDYYLSYIYLHLERTDLCSDLSYFQNSVLCVIPKTCKKIQINIYVTPAESCFKLSRFVPNLNNIRKNLFEEFRDVDTTQLRRLGTPFYNSVILSDLTLTENYEHVENALEDLENVKVGIKLLSVWLQQRNLHLERGFSENLLAQTILYLVLKRKLNKHMSSYQVIRNFWVFVSTTNWHENPISICEHVKPDRLSAFREAFDVVFLDTSGCYNLAAFLHLNVYMKVRSEAEFAVKYLDNVNFDSFGALFMTEMSPELQYDALLILKDSKSFKNIYNSINATQKCKYMGCYQTLITKRILFLLSKGLNKRATHIVPLSLEQSNNSSFTQITFGLTLNPNEAFKIIEKGPPANSPEAIEFRQFWGKLSECRRFADGSICEAVYFPTKTIQDKRKIFKKILEFIATEKLRVEEHKVIADEFENMLVLKNYITPFPTGTNEEASLKIIEIFDELAKKLREFNLPLEITTVQGVSEVFSYTALFPPIPTNYRWGGKLTVCKGNNIILNERAKFRTVPKYVEPVECVLQLGMNSKWPNNYEALKHLKVGFYLELSKKLQEDFQIISHATREYLDVLYNGLVFRFRLYNPREISALKKFTTPNGVTSFKDTEESVELEKNLHILPRIVSALHGIQSNNPTFGLSTSLIKRWLRCQMIDEYYIPDIVVDLLNASFYLACTPYTSPNLPQVAFLRFVKHIGDFDWNSQAIIVNFNDELTSEVLGHFESNFQENRHNYPVLCIVTPYDEGKSLFSKKCSKEVARRLSLLAKSTYEIVNIDVISQNLSEIEDLFIPNFDGYNALIHLKPLLNPRRHQQIDVVKADESKMVIEAYNEEENSKIPVVGFNPVEFYIKQLRENYGNLALFFYDSYGGNVIGVLWLPKVLEPTEFQASHVEGRKLVNNKLVLNKAAILEDFLTLGKGLVKSVQECNT